MRIIGYTCNGEAFCPHCAWLGYSAGELTRTSGIGQFDEHDMPTTSEDWAGNPVAPVFSTDEQPTPLSCEHCGDTL